MYNWVNFWLFLTKTILVFVKNIITIEQTHYLIIHYPVKYFQKKLGEGWWFVVSKFSGISRFVYWNYLNYFHWLGTIPIIIDLFIMWVNGYLMHSIDSWSSSEDISSWSELSLSFNLFVISRTWSGSIVSQNMLFIWGVFK